MFMSEYGRLFKRRFGYLLALLLASVSGFSQNSPRGAILDAAIYDALPQKAVQVSRAYESLPKAISLREYAPYAGDQGVYETCTAWATSYAARSMLESINLERRDRAIATESAFSPSYVYKKMFAFNGKPDAPDGMRRAAISWALNFLRAEAEGAVKMSEHERRLPFTSILLSMFDTSRKYPIAEYATLFRSTVTNPAVKIQAVKKSLVESKPVVIGMRCPDSFQSVRRDVWRPIKNSAEDSFGHAMCVTGYDDTKYGGAFEVMNSWGEKWGNKGFVWIPYEAFADAVLEAYDLTDNLTLYLEKAEFSGFAQIEVHGGEGMSVKFQNGYYETLNSYKSGTRFRYLLGNKNASFVYAFAADNTNAEPTRIFPPEGVSAMLDYSENVVAFPGEDTSIRLDDRNGTDYLAVLYSKRALDIAAIQNRFKAAQGAFPERVATAVGTDYLPYPQVGYAPAKLEFTASTANKNAVLGLLLAIKHE
jgi:hypothetical protein